MNLKKALKYFERSLMCCNSTDLKDKKKYTNKISKLVRKVKRILKRREGGDQ